MHVYGTPCGIPCEHASGSFGLQDLTLAANQEDVGFNITVCCVCRKKGDATKLFLCDCCPVAFHAACLDRDLRKLKASSEVLCGICERVSLPRAALAWHDVTRVPSLPQPCHKRGMYAALGGTTSVAECMSKRLVPSFRLACLCHSDMS